MPNSRPIGSYGQNQALQAHVWAKNGPRTAETRPDLVYRDGIGIRTRLSYPSGQHSGGGRRLGDGLALRSGLVDEENEFF